MLLWPCLCDLLCVVVLFYTKPFLTDHALDQEMEIEALEAILMDDFKGLNVFCVWKIVTEDPKSSILFYLVPGNERGVLFSSACAMPEIHSSESGLNTSSRCFQITLSPQVQTLLCAISLCVVAK